MGLWSEHGTSWYNCNRFEERSGLDGRDAQAKSRQSLERYLHYYNRYANHEQSAKLDKDLATKTNIKMKGLASTSGMSWIEVEFLKTASQTLQTCRQTLKWTYAFAYYLQRNNLTEIFEDNQKDFEMAVESLSEMFEKPIQELAALKVDMMDKTSYCNKRRVILLDDTAQNLKTGMLNSWKACQRFSDIVQANGSLMWTSLWALEAFDMDHLRHIAAFSLAFSWSEGWYFISDNDLAYRMASICSESEQGASAQSIYILKEEFRQLDQEALFSLRSMTL